MSNAECVARYKQRHPERVRAYRRIRARRVREACRLEGVCSKCTIRDARPMRKTCGVC